MDCASKVQYSKVLAFQGDLIVGRAKSSRIRAGKARVRTLRDSNSIELWDQFQHQIVAGSTGPATRLPLEMGSGLLKA